MNKALYPSLWVVFIALYAANCGVSVQTGTRVESHPPASLSPDGGKYTLRYGDVLEVKFLYHPELDGSLTVRPDGEITAPFVGDLRVIGFTLMQVDSLITEAVSRTLSQSDQVSVMLRQVGVQNVYVLGEVAKPGEYPLHRRMTVLQSIGAAQGYLNTAEMKSVLLIRRNPSGQPVAQRLNLTSEVLEEKAIVDPFLEPLDIVYVPKTFIAQVDLFLDQHFTRLLPPLLLYLTGYQVLNP